MRLIRLLAALAVLAGCALAGAAPAAAAAGHSVTISGYAFKPAMLTITVGDTVTWTNLDTAPHDVTVVIAVHSAELAIPKRCSLPSRLPPVEPLMWSVVTPARCCAGVPCCSAA